MKTLMASRQEATMNGPRAKVVPFPSQAAGNPIAEPLMGGKSAQIIPFHDQQPGKKTPPKITCEEVAPESLLALASIYDAKPDGIMELYLAKVQLTVGTLRIGDMSFIPSLMRSEIIGAVMDPKSMAGGMGLADLVVIKAREAYAKWTKPVPKAAASTSSVTKADGQKPQEYALLKIFEEGRSGLKDYW